MLACSIPLPVHRACMQGYLYQEKRTLNTTKPRQEKRKPIWQGYGRKYEPSCTARASTFTVSVLPSLNTTAHHIGIYCCSCRKNTSGKSEVSYGTMRCVKTAMKRARPSIAIKRNA